MGYKYEEKKIRYDELTATIADKQSKSGIIENFIMTLKKMNGIVEPSKTDLGGGTVEYVITFYKKESDIYFLREYRDCSRSVRQ